MPNRRATYSDYQARASAFRVGDRVYPILKGNPASGGTVVAVWPAIGMVDVQFPHGNSRYPVEDLAIDSTATKDIENVVDVMADSVPGGAGTVSVPGGPSPLMKDRPEPLQSFLENEGTLDKSINRVASAYIKKAVYWTAPDRKYKASREEITSGNFCCPKCDESYLRKVVYKRDGGASEKLFCCPSCLFLIKRTDIIGME